MALINCPECKKEVSDKADNCPNCGFPLNLQEISCPTFPVNMAIGNSISGAGSNFLGEFRQEDNIIRTLNSGKLYVNLHVNGLSFTPSIDNFSIHFAQIISVEFADITKFKQQNKSVIGRAIVGNLIMGPLGAVIAGMSGVEKTDLQDNSYLVINYWERFTKKAQTILIRGENEKIRAFVGRYQTLKNTISPETLKKNISALSERDKKILELCAKKGKLKALGYYMEVTREPGKQFTTEEVQAKMNAAMQYIQDLAREHGVKIKEGCFIATACYGDYDAPEVLILRQYRDNYLLTNKLGKLFVAVYYATSPFFASQIAKSDTLRNIIHKYLIHPLVSKLQEKSKNASR